MTTQDPSPTPTELAKPSDKCLDELAVLTRGLAHDLNHLLTLMDRQMAALRQAISSGGPWEERLRALENTQQRAKALGRQLRRAGSRHTLQRVPIELGARLRDCREMWSPEARVHLSFSCPTEDLWVWADPEGLDRILLNLCENALAAVEHEGWVRLKVSRGPRWTELLVADNGPGLPENVKVSLFSELGPTPKGGEGLGLVVAYLIADEMGGSLRLSQTGPEGTTFRLRLENV